MRPLVTLTSLNIYTYDRVGWSKVTSVDKELVKYFNDMFDILNKLAYVTP